MYPTFVWPSSSLVWCHTSPLRLARRCPSTNPYHTSARLSEVGPALRTLHRPLSAAFGAGMWSTYPHRPFIAVGFNIKPIHLITQLVAPGTVPFTVVSPPAFGSHAYASPTSLWKPSLHSTAVVRCCTSNTLNDQTNQSTVFDVIQYACWAGYCTTYNCH